MAMAYPAVPVICVERQAEREDIVPMMVFLADSLLPKDVPERGRLLSLILKSRGFVMPVETKLASCRPESALSPGDGDAEDSSRKSSSSGSVPDLIAPELTDPGANLAGYAQDVRQNQPESGRLDFRRTRSAGRFSMLELPVNETSSASPVRVQLSLDGDFDDKLVALASVEDNESGAEVLVLRRGSGTLAVFELISTVLKCHSQAWRKDKVVIVMPRRPRSGCIQGQDNVFLRFETREQLKAFAQMAGYAKVQSSKSDWAHMLRGNTSQSSQDL